MECGVTREWGRSALDRVIRYRLTEKLGSTRLRNHLRATVLVTNSTGMLCTYRTVWDAQLGGARPLHRSWGAARLEGGGCYCCLCEPRPPL